MSHTFPFHYISERYFLIPRDIKCHTDYAHLCYITQRILQIAFIYFITSVTTWFLHNKFNIILSLSPVQGMEDFKISGD